ncbi:hypothetical protein NPIL_204631 [Nephila pilipes]|uniref:Uncharacterized protein n=1 Tax=Nephila pilipes TaxID=299642 RepID=A0A8X6PAZ1_NEPPI|nr:hypothetical protein NPIL_204631 [Nephila pilipes]
MSSAKKLFLMLETDLRASPHFVWNRAPDLIVGVRPPSGMSGFSGGTSGKICAASSHTKQPFASKRCSFCCWAHRLTSLYVKWQHIPP